MVDVDLRRDVTAEQDALKVCREIIDECRPRFICILGGRYGWTPHGQERSIIADGVHYAALGRLDRDECRYFCFRNPDATASIPEDAAREGGYREFPTEEDIEKQGETGPKRGTGTGGGQVARPVVESDTRVLMGGDPAIVRMVRIMVDTAMRTGGYVMCIGNDIPWHGPRHVDGRGGSPSEQQRSLDQCRRGALGALTSEEALRDPSMARPSAATSCVATRTPASSWATRPCGPSSAGARSWASP